MLSILQTIAERKIQQAMTEGTLLDLSHWKNKPLPPDDMADVPADLRMAYRLLKNAGYVPEEIAMQKEITRIEQLLANCTDEKEKVRQLRKISCLRTKLEGAWEGQSSSVKRDRITTRWSTGYRHPRRNKTLY